MDRLSRQWVTAWPTHSFEFGYQEFGEVFTTYLGLESPVVRGREGSSIPCASMARARRGEPLRCDPFGKALANAVLPGGFKEPHDDVEWELFEITKDAGLQTELQPRHLFTSVVPVAHLLDQRNNGTIVPDASCRVALPPVSFETNQPRVRALSARTQLFDIKTIHRGGGHYRTGSLTNGMQSGAVMQRARVVNNDYVKNARKLDRQHSSTGTTPIEARLRSFGDVRATVFGAYGEASRDVHLLLGVAADEMATRLWDNMGARTKEEARAFIIGALRRRMGLAAVRAMARHRLRRVPWIGVDRQVVVDRRQRGYHDPQAQARGRMRMEGAVNPDDFLAHQARAIAVA